MPRPRQTWTVEKLKLELRHRGVTGISTLSRADLETRLKASWPEWTEESVPTYVGAAADAGAAPAGAAAPPPAHGAPEARAAPLRRSLKAFSRGKSSGWAPVELPLDVVIVARSDSRASVERDWRPAFVDVYRRAAALVQTRPPHVSVTDASWIIARHLDAPLRVVLMHTNKALQAASKRETDAVELTRVISVLTREGLVLLGDSTQWELIHLGTDIGRDRFLEIVHVLRCGTRSSNPADNTWDRLSRGADEFVGMEEAIAEALDFCRPRVAGPKVSDDSFVRTQSGRDAEIPRTLIMRKGGFGTRLDVVSCAITMAIIAAELNRTSKEPMSQLVAERLTSGDELYADRGVTNGGLVARLLIRGVSVVGVQKASNSNAHPWVADVGKVLARLEPSVLERLLDERAAPFSIISAHGLGPRAAAATRGNEASIIVRQRSSLSGDGLVIFTTTRTNLERRSEDLSKIVLVEKPVSLAVKRRNLQLRAAEGDEHACAIAAHLANARVETRTLHQGDVAWLHSRHMYYTGRTASIAVYATLSEVTGFDLVRAALGVAGAADAQAAAHAAAADADAAQAAAEEEAEAVQDEAAAGADDVDLDTLVEVDGPVRSVEDGVEDGESAGGAPATGVQDLPFVVEPLMPTGYASPSPPSALTVPMDEATSLPPAAPSLLTPPLGAGLPAPQLALPPPEATSPAPPPLIAAADVAGPLAAVGAGAAPADAGPLPQIAGAPEDAPGAAPAAPALTALERAVADGLTRVVRTGLMHVSRRTVRMSEGHDSESKQLTFVETVPEMVGGRVYTTGLLVALNTCCAFSVDGLGRMRVGDSVVVVGVECKDQERHAAAAAHDARHVTVVVAGSDQYKQLVPREHRLQLLHGAAMLSLSYMLLVLSAPTGVSQLVLVEYPPSLRAEYVVLMALPRVRGVFSWFHDLVRRGQPAPRAADVIAAIPPGLPTDVHASLRSWIPFLTALTVYAFEKGTLPAAHVFRSLLVDNYDVAKDGTDQNCRIEEALCHGSALRLSAAAKLTRSLINTVLAAGFRAASIYSLGLPALQNPDATARSLHRDITRLVGRTTNVLWTVSKELGLSDLPVGAISLGALNRGAPPAASLTPVAQRRALAAYPEQALALLEERATRRGHAVGPSDFLPGTDLPVASPLVSLSTPGESRLNTSRRTAQYYAQFGEVFRRIQLRGIMGGLRQNTRLDIWDNADGILLRHAANMLLHEAVRIPSMRTCLLCTMRVQWACVLCGEALCQKDCFTSFHQSPLLRSQQASGQGSTGTASGPGSVDAASGGGAPAPGAAAATAGAVGATVGAVGATAGAVGATAAGSSTGEASGAAPGGAASSSAATGGAMAHSGQDGAAAGGRPARDLRGGKRLRM